MQFFKSSSLPFWLISLSVGIGLTLPVLIQDAMFQDAVLYSAVSHNLSIGFGTFWFPQYSLLNLEGISSFHEQLPLVFGIQSLFYRVLGDSIYVERFYVFLLIVAHVFLINYLWKSIFFIDENRKSFGWLPVLFWITIPVCFWSFRGNMLENTVSLFALISVVISFSTIKGDNKWYLWLLSGFFIFLASFSKGVPGFFPLAFPFLYWLIIRDISFKQCIYYTILLISISITLYVVFYIIPTSRESLNIYIFERLLKRVTSTSGYRLSTLWRLFQELIPLILISLITYVITKWKLGKSYFSEYNKMAWLFLAIGFSAIFPLMLTLVQKGFYIVPGLPYLGIGFALFVIPAFSKGINKLNENKKFKKNIIVLGIVLLLTCSVITVLQIGKIGRHADIVTDVYKIGEVVPKFATLTIPEEMYYQYDFVLQGFLVRNFNISISPYKQYAYFLRKKDEDMKIPDGYKPLNIELQVYDLYENKSKPVWDTKTVQHLQLSEN